MPQSEVDAGYQKLAEARMQREIEDGREWLLENRHLRLPPVQVTFSPPSADEGWQRITPEVQSQIRAKMLAWYGGPDEVMVGPKAAKVLEETLVERDRFLNHPSTPMHYTTRDGRKELIDRGVSHQREKPPVGCSDGVVSWFDAATGFPVDPDFVKTLGQLTSFQFKPARLELPNESWWEPEWDLAQVRYRGDRVRWVRAGDPEPEED